MSANSSGTTLTLPPCTSKLWHYVTENSESITLMTHQNDSLLTASREQNASLARAPEISGDTKGINQTSSPANIRMQEAIKETLRVF